MNEERVAIPVIMIATPMEPELRARAEALTAEFVHMCMNTDGMQAFGMGAAIALMCFIDPLKVSDLLAEDDEEAATRVGRLGLSQVQDIVRAHDAAHRVGHLVQGMTEQEVTDLVERVTLPDKCSRAGAVRKLEEQILQERI